MVEEISARSTCYTTAAASGSRCGVLDDTEGEGEGERERVGVGEVARWTDCAGGWIAPAASAGCTPRRVTALCSDHAPPLSTTFSSFSPSAALPPSMPKPTIIQTLLNRPSQHYSFPAQKNYHSTKQELIRVATEAQHGSEAGPSHSQRIGSPTPASPSQPYACPAPVRPERRRSRKRRRTVNEPEVGPEDISEVSFDAP